MAWVNKMDAIISRTYRTVTEIWRGSKNAGKELSWQWFFPANSLTRIAETKEYKRYHLHETVVQKAIKKAVNAAHITKRASAHTFRHSFAASKLWYSHYSGIAGSQWFKNYHDLYPYRPEPNNKTSKKSARFWFKVNGSCCDDWLVLADKRPFSSTINEIKCF